MLPPGEVTGVQPGDLRLEKIHLTIDATREVAGLHARRHTAAMAIALTFGASAMLLP
jgi:hypothetical protein